MVFQNNLSFKIKILFQIFYRDEYSRTVQICIWFWIKFSKIFCVDTNHEGPWKFWFDVHDMLKIDICFHVHFQNYHIKNKIFIFFKIQLITFFWRSRVGLLKTKRIQKGRWARTCVGFLVVFLHVRRPDGWDFVLLANCLIWVFIIMQIIMARMISSFLSRK